MAFRQVPNATNVRIVPRRPCWCGSTGGLSYRIQAVQQEGLDVAAAADVVWTLTSPEVHHMLLEIRGWTREQYETWLRDTLERSLLREATGYP